MGTRTHFAGTFATFLVAAGFVHAAQAEPLRLRYAVWPGFGPLFVAKEKGLFAEEGVEVDLIEMEEHTATFAALAAGQIDAVLGSIPDTPAFSKPGEEPLGCALVFDESFGGDGVLATTDIGSIAALEGKSVAILYGSVSQFYLNVLLDQAGLAQTDVQVVDLTAEDAVTALMLQEIDAAVTWEPWLSQGRAVEHVHMLTDSSQQPGLIVDCLITTASAFNERRAEFRAWRAPGSQVSTTSKPIPTRPWKSWPGPPAAVSRGPSSPRPSR